MYFLTNLARVCQGKEYKFFQLKNKNTHKQTKEREENHRDRDAHVWSRCNRDGSVKQSLVFEFDKSTYTFFQVRRAAKVEFFFFFFWIN